jgi:hypothetical protein
VQPILSPRPAGALPGTVEWPLVADPLRVVPRFAVFCNPLTFNFAPNLERVTETFFWRG